MLTKEKGITLIALVVTIIVLLILAGISITFIVGENGIIEKANVSDRKYKEAIVCEQVSLAWNTCKADYIGNNKEILKEECFSKENLNANLNYGEITAVGHDVNAQGDSEVVYKMDDKFYKVIVHSNNLFKVEVGGVAVEPPITELPTENLLTKVSTNKELYYGKKVSGYTANGISDWRIFYADDENVFLITADYLTQNQIINRTNNTMAVLGEHGVIWNEVPEEVELDAQKVAKFSPVTDETVAWSGDYTANPNGKAISTLLDTEQWNMFLDKEDGTGKGKMVIGSPTVNMMVASWNTKYSNDKVYVNNSNDKGYYIGTATSPTTFWQDMSKKNGFTNVEAKDNMYFPHKDLAGAKGVRMLVSKSKWLFLYNEWKARNLFNGFI